jgi:hypothetical protein
VAIAVVALPGFTILPQRVKSWTSSPFFCVNRLYAMRSVSSPSACSFSMIA